MESILQVPNTLTWLNLNEVLTTGICDVGIQVGKSSNRISYPPASPSSPTIETLILPLGSRIQAILPKVQE